MIYRRHATFGTKLLVNCPLCFTVEIPGSLVLVKLDAFKLSSSGTQGYIPRYSLPEKYECPFEQAQRDFLVILID